MTVLKRQLEADRKKKDRVRLTEYKARNLATSLALLLAIPQPNPKIAPHKLDK